jgi:hypothetical protein
MLGFAGLKCQSLESVCEVMIWDVRFGLTLSCSTGNVLKFGNRPIKSFDFSNRLSMEA